MSAPANPSSAPKLDPADPPISEWDQLSIDTPELVAIDLPVAGLGSRFVALLVDYLIWLAALILVVLLIALVDPSLARYSKIGEKWAKALFILVPFLFLWGYFTLFEAFWHGQTPGKRVAKIRVIQISGRGIGLFESMTRNLVRFVDQFPGIYVVGTVCIFLSRRHQRLGDMAAGTLVVHEREHLSDSNLSSSLNSTTLNLYVSPSKYPSHSTVSQLTNAIPTPNLARLGPHDLQVLEAFFARRLDFSLELRQSLAHRLAHSIAAKAQLQIPPNLSTELFLEQVAHQLRDLSRLH